MILFQLDVAIYNVTLKRSTSLRPPESRAVHAYLLKRLPKLHGPAGSIISFEVLERDTGRYWFTQPKFFNIVTVKIHQNTMDID